jgi:hypothetical protein
MATSLPRFLAPLAALTMLAAACSSATTDESFNASESEAQACNDSPPDGSGYSCAQQKEWGKCGETWMAGHCQTACGTCAKATACTDVPDGSGYSCAQQKEWGKCGEPWMQGKCDATCGRCGATSAPPPPPSPAPAGGGAACGADACKAPNGVTWNCEKRFMYGTNWAWKKFGADFGGIGAWGQKSVSQAPAEYAPWLADMKASGASTVRWWMFPSFATDGIIFDASGTPTGVTPTLLADVRTAIDLAKQKDVYLMLTLFSFDTFRPGDVSGRRFPTLKSLAQDPTKRAALLANVVRPIAEEVEKSANRARVVSWDMMNEPEWAITGSDPYGDPGFDAMSGLEAIPFADMERLFNEMATTLHRASKAQVTIGSAAIKWGKAWQRVPLDFYQLHFYGWIYEYYPVTKVTPASVGMGNKPVVMGEFPIEGLAAIPAKGLPALDMPAFVKDLWSVGYAGAMAWDANSPLYAQKRDDVRAFSSCQTTY